MTIIYSDDSGPVIWPDTDLHDPLSKKFYYIEYKPPVHTISTAYTKGVDVVVPTAPNGCMYECISGGISGAIAPTFGTDEGKSIVDGTVLWKCKPLVSKLETGDTITASTWTADTGVTLSDDVIVNGIMTAVKVNSVPASATKFKITNHYTITRASGRIDELIKSIIIPIKSI